MSYRGKTAQLPCGRGGLDGNQNVFQIAINNLVKARNLRFDGYTWRKAPGMTKFDTTAVTGSPICYAGIDWRPNPGTQRQVTAWSNGNVYKETGGDIDAITLKSGLSIGTYPVTLVEGGNIAAGDDRRLFLYAKGVAPQQLLADGVTMSGITAESPDWSSNKPGAAVYHDARIYAFDVDSAPHNFYISSLNDHGSFDNTNQADARVYAIAPGYGDKIAAAWSYLPQQLYVFKYPRGIWMVDTTDVTGFYLPINLVRSDVGMAGPHGVCKVDQETYFITSNGRLMSLTALVNGVDPENADLTRQLRLTTFIKDNVNATMLKFARLVYDESRRELHYIYTSKNGTTNDSALVFDINEDGVPKVATEDRGKYFHAVWPRIGADGFVEFLAAGDSGGFVRRLNSPNRSIDATVPYTVEFQYADSDLDFVPRNVYKPVSVGSLQKRFDLMEITVIPTGVATTTLEFIIDGESRKTVSVDLGDVGSDTFDTAVFDTAIFGGQTVFKHRVPIECNGNQFSVRVANSGLNEDIAIVNLKVYFQLQGQNYEA